MKNNFSILLLVVILWGNSLMACHDIIDKDLTNAPMIVNNPADSFVTGNYTVTFLWEEVSGASDYRLQISQPSFDNIQRLVLDTVLKGNKLLYTVYPGIFQWRIRAENGSSHTAYLTRRFVVDSNDDLSQQTFVTNGPADHYISNNGVVTFTWNPFPYATSYELVLTNFSGVIVTTKQTTGLSISDTLTEGKYTWKARATNSNNNTTTQFSSDKQINIDLTPPDPSLPYRPINNAIDSNIITFTWKKPADVFQDSIIISQDSAFNTTYLTALVTNDTLYRPGLLPINQSYYWRLRSRDSAGNWSIYSVKFRLNIQ